MGLEHACCGSPWLRCFLGLSTKQCLLSGKSIFIMTRWLHVDLRFPGFCWDHSCINLGAVACAILGEYWLFCRDIEMDRNWFPILVELFPQIYHITSSDFFSRSQISSHIALVFSRSAQGISDNSPTLLCPSGLSFALRAICYDPHLCRRPLWLEGIG